MTTWFTSDQHFQHSRILLYCEKTRPFKDIDHMARELIARHNSVVQDGDTVYNVGDFSLSEKHVPDVLKQLKGSQILIEGNHDQVFHTRWKYEAAIRRYLEYGFKAVLMNSIVEPFLVHHMPYIADERHGERYAEHRPKDKGRPLIHGHAHGKLGKFHHGNQIDVGVDCWDCTPVALETLLELIK